MTPHTLTMRLLGCAVVTTSIGTLANAADLTDRTRQAFDRYVQITEARIEQEVTADGPVLWLDRQPERDRVDYQRRLRAGEVVIARLESRDQGDRLRIPDGMVHHWVGTVFIAGATLPQTLALVQNYDKYGEIYQPAVRRAKLVAQDGLRFKSSMQLFMKKIISVVLNADFDVLYRQLGPMRTHARGLATRIAEVEDPDTPQAHEKPVGHDGGFLWRFNNYCTFEQRDGGTYMQCESVSLSRDIPRGLGWLIGPFVTSIPRETLTFTLTATRNALTKNR